MRILFKFNFDDSYLNPEADTKEITYVFEILDGDSILDKFKKFEEDTEFFLEQAEDLESDYGTHDYFATFSTEEYIVGYSAYEVERILQQELLERWRQYFIDNGFMIGPLELEND